MKRLIGALLLSATALFSSDLNTGGFSGVHTVKSAAPLGLGGVNVGGTFRYGRQWEYVSSSALPLDKSAQLIDGSLFTGVGVGRHWDLAIQLPFHADIPGWDDIKTANMGDLEVSTRMVIPTKNEKPLVNAALLFTLTTPTGSDASGAFTRYTYYDGKAPFTGDRLYYAPSGAFTIHFDRSKTEHPVRLHLNGGAVLCNEKSLNAVNAGMGLEVFPTDWLTIFTETYGTVRIENLHWEKFYSHLNNGQLWVSPGAKFTLPNGIYFTVSGDLGLSEKESGSHKTYAAQGNIFTAKENPLFNGRLTFGWEKKGKAKDTDGDGIPNAVDNCPNAAEDMDGFNDGDGCPEIDNDLDSIPDGEDKCPVVAEDLDNFQDEDGCPEYDNDLDSIPDTLDQCPLEQEDMDGFADDDGCPEIDNDNDSFVDSLDKCPVDAEDKDGYMDEDGCPDYDNDGDNVPDSLDACPNTAGTGSNGCPEAPKAKEISRDGLVLKGVNFRSGKATLTPESYDALDEVVESLRDWPEVTLEIQGHTDASGSYNGNVRISRARAETVRRYFIERGISGDRLTAVGYGPDRPLASNSTANGRAKNRRVELQRTDTFR